MKRHLSKDNLTTPKKPRLLQIDQAENPVIIAYNEDIQRVFQKNNVPYGVRFEIARRTCGGTEMPTEYIELLGTLGKNASNAKSMPQLEKSEQANWSAEEVTVSSPWAELDQEEEAFSKDGKYAGIGNNPDYPGWWAGKVDFRATLKLVDEKYRIVLERCSLGPSCKLKRRFGSKNLLRVKVHEKILYDKNHKLLEYFKRPFVIWDTCYEAFFAKDDTVFLFKTNKVMENGRLYTKTSGLNIEQFIQWMNPSDFNTGQKMCKWASRMALGLSSSVPGPRFAPENLKVIEDIFSEDGSNMTDGCGLSTIVLPKLVFHMHQLDSVPVAIQARVFGSKGLFLMDRELEPSEDPELHIRKSQVKISYSPSAPLDLSHCTIDLLRFSGVKTPARSSEETIKNLYYNGVPAKVFKQLLESRLCKTVDGLLAWDGPDAMYKLWKAIEQAENVLSARRARQSPTESRWKGLGEQGLDEDLNEDEDDIGNKSQEQHSLPWRMDPTSGCPSSIAESAMGVLEVGFTPQCCLYLRDKISNLIKMKVKAISSNFRYDIPQSASAFVVPDPYGVLGPDEIHFKSSKREFPMNDDLKADIIVGDVLMTRNPCKVPTDVRKVRAVEHPRLSSFVDVIVCSIQGNRRLLDFLAGGDYDGDRATVIWDLRLVVPFISADETFSKPPDDIDSDFDIDEQTVGEFFSKMSTCHPKVRVAALQDYLLGALKNASLVGEYSKFHENASYMEGYGANAAYRFSYKFCITLDAAKTGHKIRPKVYEEDKRKYGFGHRQPAYKTLLDTKKRTFSRSNDLPLQQPNHLRTSIMEILARTALEQRDIWLSYSEKRVSGFPFNVPDGDLTAPWTEAVAQARNRGAREYQDDLAMISRHVERMYEKRIERYKDGGGDFTQQDIRIRQDKLRKLSKEFAASPTTDSMKTIMDTSTIERLRASYAYDYASKRGSFSSRFPFDMAFRELCAIKAKACGPYKVCGQGFYERFKLTGFR